MSQELRRVRQGPTHSLVHLLFAELTPDPGGGRSGTSRRAPRSTSPWHPGICLQEAQHSWLGNIASLGPDGIQKQIPWGWGWGWGWGVRGAENQVP